MCMQSLGEFQAGASRQGQRQSPLSAQSYLGPLTYCWIGELCLPVRLE